MEKFFEEKILFYIRTFIVAHPYLGYAFLGIIVILWILSKIVDKIPKIDVLKSNILIPAAKHFEYKKLVKAAIKNDIRGHVNREISKIKNELPCEWLKEIDIEWTKKDSEDSFFEKQNLVIRAQPIACQDRNFINVTYNYLRTSFFPKVQKVIPETHREAAVLYMCNRIVGGWKKEAINVFNDYILEPAIEKKKNVIEYFERYKKIDARGLFTSTFLREIQEIASKIRLTSYRGRMGEEVTKVLGQLENFYDGLAKKGNDTIPEDAWIRQGPVTTYGIMLVAMPLKVKRAGPQGYVNRAKEFSDKGVSRLYVLGSGQEARFFEQVTSLINVNTDFKLAERFELNKDYRGKYRGAGALFVKK